MECNDEMTKEDSERVCREQLERFFGNHLNAAMKKRVLKALRFLSVSDKPLAKMTTGIPKKSAT